MSGVEKKLVGCVQFEVRDGRVEENLAAALNGIERLAGRGARLVVLPEMFSSGFHYPALGEMARQTPRVVERLREQAARLGVAVYGSCPELAGEKVYNTAYLIDGRGELAATYRKVHLFSAAGEVVHFAAGEAPALGTAAGLRLGLITCYDLRFPELARTLTLSGAQVLCASAEWPAARAEHWRLLVRARALENQLPVLACNCCGRSAAGILYGGGSLLASAEGEVLAEAGTGPEDLLAGIDTAQAQDFRKRLPAIHERRPGAYRLGRAIGQKLTSAAELAPRLKAMQAAGARVVFTNGCFDLLHVGHVRYLAQARALGDCLVVGLNTDASVRRIKGTGQGGPERPVVEEARRAEVLAALAAVDFVVLFDEDTPERLIAELQPDVLVKGADWALEEIAGREIVEARGGRVVRIETTRGASTTSLIEAIRKG